MKYKIIPTVFAHSKKEFNNRFNKLISISREIQIDFMDNRFVKAKSVSIRDVPNLKKYKNNFEAHLMVKKPLLWINNLKDKGFKKVIFHYEALKDQDKIKKVISLIQERKMKVFIALNPETDINKIVCFLLYIDGVLLMGHEPGIEYVKLLPSIYMKIRSLRFHSKKIAIQIDGGVSDKNIKKLANAGANIFNIGSFVADAENPLDALLRLKDKLR